MRPKILDSGAQADKKPDTLSVFQTSHNGDSEPSEIFFELTRHLRSEFKINKGVLLLRPDAGSPLAAVSTWNNGQTREGLAIKLPSDSSLFEQVAKQGLVYTENFGAAFSGNFFEKKLLLEDDTKSFVLQPLKHNGEVIGLLGFSSDQATAFTLFEEGAVEKVVADFTEIIRERLWAL